MNLQEQKKHAEALIFELLQFGINRGAYSSIEVQGIHNATRILTTPEEVTTPLPEQEPEVASADGPGPIIKDPILPPKPAVQ